MRVGRSLPIEVAGTSSSSTEQESQYLFSVSPNDLPTSCTVG